MPTTDPLTYQCRHIFLDGHRCGSRALRGEPVSYEMVWKGRASAADTRTRPLSCRRIA